MALLYRGAACFCRSVQHHPYARSGSVGLPQRIISYCTSLHAITSILLWWPVCSSTHKSDQRSFASTYQCWWNRYKSTLCQCNEEVLSILPALTSTKATSRNSNHERLFDTLSYLTSQHTSWNDKRGRASSGCTLLMVVCKMARQARHAYLKKFQSRLPVFTVGQSCCCRGERRATERYALNPVKPKVKPKVQSQEREARSAHS